jgi:putative intracellular protease/amidase
MHIGELIAGARVLLEDGSVVEVTTPSKDGRSVTVLYLEAPFNPDLVGTQAECTDFDIVAYAGTDTMNSATPPDAKQP